MPDSFALPGAAPWGAAPGFLQGEKMAMNLQTRLLLMAALALVEVVFLWLSVLFTMLAFFGRQTTAGWLFVPYLAWVSFAGILNLAIWWLN